MSHNHSFLRHPGWTPTSAPPSLKVDILVQSQTWFLRLVLFGFVWIPFPFHWITHHLSLSTLLISPLGKFHHAQHSCPISPQLEVLTGPDHFHFHFQTCIPEVQWTWFHLLTLLFLDHSGILQSLINVTWEQGAENQKCRAIPNPTSIQDPSQKTLLTTK